MKNAFISCENGFTIFCFKETTLRFKAPYSLEYYANVVEWDHGYLVVMAKYKHNDECEEESIDLIPILTDLYIDPDTFLSEIDEVKIA